MDRNAMRVFQNRREQETHERLERLLSAILDGGNGELPDLGMLVGRLEEVRTVSLAAFPPQCNAAVNAIMAQAKLLGMVVDRQAIGKPQDYNMGHDEEAAIYERLRERLGPEHVERFRQIVEKMRDAFNGPVIDGEAEEIE
jgi:hypothetical protein